MKIGRAKIWFAQKSKVCFLERKNFFSWILGREVVRWTSNLKDEKIHKAGIQVSRSLGEAKDFAKEEGKTVLDYGYTTYWIWRFMLTIYTPEFHSKNPW